jgi:hypothetical protein
MAMVPEGLDVAVRLMVPGEVSSVRAAPGYAYDGRADRPEVCPLWRVYGLPLLRMQAVPGVFVAVHACLEAVQTSTAQCWLPAALRRCRYQAM